MLLVRTYLASSPIAGIGVFAADAIRKCTPIWRFTPGFDVLLPADFEHGGDGSFVEIYTQRCETSGMLLLCADNARFMNHSDDPNVHSAPPLSDPCKADLALRDIAAGEELTCDYRLAEPLAAFNGFGKDVTRLLEATCISSVIR